MEQVNETVREQLEPEVRDLLRGGDFYLQENEDGTFTGEIYADYRDQLDSKTAVSICQDPHPMEKFYEALDVCYEDYVFQLQSELCQELTRKMEAVRPEHLTRAEESALMDIITDTVYYEYPTDHYLKQEFPVNVMLDTGDANYDYVLNCVYPCWYGEYGVPIDRRAGIVWLARSQGFSKTRLQNALKQGDLVNPQGFLESMRVELANLPSSMSIVTFLTSMTLDQLIAVNTALQYRKQERDSRRTGHRSGFGCLTLGKETMTGLFDPWSGGGSLLEVELEKDVKVPFSIIRSVLPDGGDGQYSISSVYGMCLSAWRDTVREIHIPPKLMSA